MKAKLKINTNNLLDLIIKTWIFYLLFVFLSTELLSLFNLVSRTSIIIIYSIIALIGFVLWFKYKITISFDSLKKIKKSDKFVFLLIILTILLPLLFTALYYPPNNWDSMTYHMARIMHWIDNKNVNFYLTHNDRQLFSSPLAEYVILHWYLLVDSDIFSNLVQYFSLIITTCASFLISKFLSKNKKTNLLSIVLVLTTPMAIMQASSTQNDLVVSSILLSTIYLGFKKSWLSFGLSIGLGMLTKNTYAIFALPFCIYFGVKWLKEYKQKAILLFLLFLLCVIFINSMHWYRNYKEFASPVGPKYMSEQMLNNDHSLQIITSNIVKNTGLQIGLPLKKYNSYVDKLIYDLHKIMNLEINDSGNSWYSIKYQTQFSIHEDLTGNFLLTIFLIFSFLFLFKEKEKTYYGFAIISGLIIFNYLFKWQPWGSRLMLPILLVSIPLISNVLIEIIRNKAITFLLIIILIICSWPFIAGSSKYFGNFPTLLNSNRQILPLSEFGRLDRFKRYFSERQILYEDFEIVYSYLNKNNIKQIDLFLNYDSWEYPWWVLAKNINPNIKIKTKLNGFNEYQNLILSDNKDYQTELNDIKLLISESKMFLFVE